jgi:hypothetical protein
MEPRNGTNRHEPKPAEFTALSYSSCLGVGLAEKCRSGIECPNDLLMKLYLVAVILFLVTFASAQTKTFRWNTELCEFSGTYDSKKYTEAQLRDTMKLFEQGDLSMGYNATVWKYEDIAKLDIPALDREYKQKTAAVKALNIVKVPYWENVRQAKLKEIEQVYQLSRLTMQAYTEPGVLRGYTRASDCKTKYAESIIAGGDDLLKTWLEVNTQSRKNNADPARIKRIFDEENASPDRLKFAVVETMSFGWWNCANAQIEYDAAASDGRHEAQFRKLFIRVREIGCDEPDE